MRYKAIKDGFFNGSERRAGKHFHGPDGLKASWFIESPEAEPAKAKVVSKANPKGAKLPDPKLSDIV